MSPYADDPRLRVAATCPACGLPAYAGTGGWSTCTRCGHSWPAHPIEVPASEIPDNLGAASVTIERLRNFLTYPPTPAERAEAQRRLDAIAERMSWR